MRGRPAATKQVPNSRPQAIQSLVQEWKTGTKTEKDNEEEYHSPSTNQSTTTTNFKTHLQSSDTKLTKL